MQKDLFGSAIAATVIPSQSDSKMDFLQKYRLNLRLDQAIIAVLLLVVAYVLVFSFGVESGKRYAMAEIKAERAMRERMARELGEKIFSSSNQPAAQAQNGVQASDTKAMPATAVVSPVKTGANTATAKTPSVKEAQIPGIQAAKTELASQNPGKFAIQTVTFTSKAAAEKHIQKLTAKGYQGKIIAKGKFQQVCVIGFETKEKALQIMGRLKSQGLAPNDSYIRPIA